MPGFGVFFVVVLKRFCSATNFVLLKQTERHLLLISLLNSPGKHFD